MAGDSASLKPEYRPLVGNAISPEDRPRVLLPLLDGINHVQEAPTDWHLDKPGVAVAKNVEMKPGEEICYPYDSPGERLNNTARQYYYIRPNARYH